MPFNVYKKKQGLVIRWSTFACYALLLLFGAYSCYQNMFPLTPGVGVNKELIPPINIPYVEIQILITPRWLISVGIGIVSIALGGYFCFFYPRSGDFLIDTESEMRKVAWPTVQKVITSSIVVILTIIVLGLFIYVVDIALFHFFTRIFHSS